MSFIDEDERKALAKEQRTRDHLEPAGLGGRATPGNIVTACRRCNNARGRVMAYYGNQRVAERALAVWPLLTTCQRLSGRTEGVRRVREERTRHRPRGRP